ncbi:arylsulfatase B-like [Amblyomma americanum]
MLRSALLSVVICACLVESRRPSSRKPSRPPHIIFLFADDVGWNDVSFHGSRQIPTPNLDALAAWGVVLQRHYSMPTCSPSRTALMTSYYPSRTSVGHMVYPAAPKGALELRFKLLPQWLKDLGYRTHMLGKWHLGYKSIEYTPTWRGFDTFFGYYNGEGYYFNHTVAWQGHCGLDMWHNIGHRVQPVTNLTGVYSTSAYTNQARKIIADHDTNKPLFLYVAYEAAHSTCNGCTPEAPQEEVDKFAYIEASNRTFFAGAVDVMDQSIGQVLEALQSRGMLADSVVVFASDNGAGPLASAAAEFPNAGSNWPLRGAKEGQWEGGVRTPALFWSGRALKDLPRAPSQQVVHLVDWAPTFYAAAGGDISKLGDVDGKDLWRALSTGTEKDRGDVIVELEGHKQMSAIISGRYKLVYRPGGPDDPQLDERVPPPRGQPPDDLDLDALMKSSAAWKALQSAARDGGHGTSSAPMPNWRQKAVLHCSKGNESSNDESVASNFDPYDAVFVFDIFGDPCETKNLASARTEVRDKLLKKLDRYRRAFHPRPGNNETDERGFPDRHRCLWEPWLGVKPAPYQNCSC